MGGCLLRPGDEHRGDHDDVRVGGALGGAPGSDASRLAAASRTRTLHRSPATARALFIIDALGPAALDTATAATDDLERRLHALAPAVRRVLVAPHA